MGLHDKKDIVVPEGLMCNTLGLTVRPSNCQKAKPGSSVHPDDPDYESSLRKLATSSIPKSMDTSTMYSTWKPGPNPLPEQAGTEDDLKTLPEMDEYPVTVPYTHNTPFADGLRTYKTHPESQANMVNNLHAGRWEARAFCRQMDLSAKNTHEGRWQNRHGRPKLDNTTPWMHEDRWQQRSGLWQKRVVDGTARGTQGQGAGQGCRQDGVWPGFTLPLNNDGTVPELRPSSTAAYRPPTWGRRGQPGALGSPTPSAGNASPSPKGAPVSVGSRTPSRSNSMGAQERKGWGGTTVLSSMHGPILRPATPPVTGSVANASPTSTTRFSRKPATLHQVSNGVGEVSPTILKMGMDRHPVIATDVTRWHLANPMSNEPPLPGSQGDKTWFGLTKTNVHATDSGITLEEVIQQIKPDQAKKPTRNLADLPSSTNPFDDPFLRDRKYTYRRIKLEEKYQQLTGKSPSGTGMLQGQ